ncbi:threonine synthase [Pullulanibacillus pueri]|nr:threonine synthase [Pullulanibacillus pueri]
MENVQCQLVCSKCSKVLPLNTLRGQCDCGGVLLAEYDFERIGQAFTKESLKQRPTTLWRYFDVLPVEDKKSVISLGEGWTPLIRLAALEKRWPLQELWIKREEQNPTGSFKARGFSVAVSLLNEHGIHKVAVPSNGNASAALAAYAGRAHMEAYVFVPKDCPSPIIKECLHYGATVYKVDGLIHDAGSIIQEGQKEQGWFNVGTLKEPGRVEGKKTMGYEVVEQLGFEFPDVIVYPTGAGSGVIGMWKAFHEMKQLGWIDGDLPRFVSVQEENCEPLVTAIEQKKDSVTFEGNEAITSAPTGMRVPQPAAGNLLLSILKETNGTAIAVSKNEIKTAQRELGCQGISSSPEGAATFAALQHLFDRREIKPTDRVVLFNTSHAMKYMESLAHTVPQIRNYREVYATLS